MEQDKFLNWMNLPQEYSGEESKFVILPVEYEKEVTFGTGAAQGSQEIIRASEHLEYYDCQFDTEPFLDGVKLLDPIKTVTSESQKQHTPQEMVNTVSATVAQQTGNRLVIGLGGDHAVTIGLVKGQEQLHEDFSVIILDAHADFRDSWNGSSLNHACVAKQVSKKHEVVIVGVRSMDIDEKKQIDSSSDVHLLLAHEFSLDKLKQLLPELKKKVYLSIDVDVLDSSIIRNTGTPEPAGLTWNQVVDILQLVFQEKQVIGADLVEFSPQQKSDFQGEAYSLAKLVYKIMALHRKISK